MTVSGSPLMFDMLARDRHDERFAEAHRERLAGHAERHRQPFALPRALPAAVRRAVASAGQRLVHLRSATSTR